VPISCSSRVESSRVLAVSRSPSPLDPGPWTGQAEPRSGPERPEVDRKVEVGSQTGRNTRDEARQSVRVHCGAQECPIVCWLDGLFGGCMNRPDYGATGGSLSPGPARGSAGGTSGWPSRGKLPLIAQARGRPREARASQASQGSGQAGGNHGQGQAGGNNGWAGLGWTGLGCAGSGQPTSSELGQGKGLGQSSQPSQGPSRGEPRLGQAGGNNGRGPSRGEPWRANGPDPSCGPNQSAESPSESVQGCPLPGAVVCRVHTPGGFSSYRRAGQSGRPRGSPRSHQPPQRSTSHCLCSAWSLLSSARPDNGSGSSCSGSSAILAARAKPKVLYGSTL
jgi:hypothetical protein